MSELPHPPRVDPILREVMIMHPRVCLLFRQVRRPIEFATGDRKGLHDSDSATDQAVLA